MDARSYMVVQYVFLGCEPVLRLLINLDMVSLALTLGVSGCMLPKFWQHNGAIAQCNHSSVLTRVRTSKLAKAK